VIRYFVINQTTVYLRSHQPTASSKDRVRKGPVGVSVLMMTKGRRFKSAPRNHERHCEQQWRSPVVRRACSTAWR
jgi:hypothetical protein